MTIKVFRKYETPEQCKSIIRDIPNLWVASGVRLRTEVHDTYEQLSRYSYLKHKDFTKEFDSELRKTFGDEVWDGLIASNVLHLDIGDKLNRITHWEHTKNPFSFFSLSLTDNQKIMVNDEEYTLNSGDAIWFKHLGGTHEIKEVKKPNTWIVTVLGDYLLDGI